MLSLSAARDLAAKNIHRAQRKYKTQYDRKATQHKYGIGDWVLVRFPNKESRKQRKLSRPWHGPYRVLSSNDPDVTVVNIYFPKDNQIQVHQSRVKPCPSEFPAGYYWYGKTKKGPGHPPKWVDQLLSKKELPNQHDSEESTEHNYPVDPESCSEEESEDEPLANDTSLAEDMHSIPITSSSDASTRAQSTRYGLRRKISPPERYT